MKYFEKWIENGLWPKKRIQQNYWQAFLNPCRNNPVSVFSKYFADNLCLNRMPFASLFGVAENEDWSIFRRNELQIDLNMNYLIADFGYGSEDGLLLDLSISSRPKIRHLLDDRRHEIPKFKAQIIFSTLDEFESQFLTEIERIS